MILGTVSPFRFFWSKIMPISYENYLSETEILEAFRRKVNDVIEEITKIETYIDTEIESIVKEYTKAEFDKLVDSFNAKIVEIEGKIDGINSDLINLEKKHDTDISRLTARIDTLSSDFDILNTEVEKILEIIQNQTTYINEQLAFNRAYSDKQLSLAKLEWASILGSMYRNVIKWVNRYFKSLASTDIYVYNGYHQRVTLQAWIDSVESRFAPDLGLTAEEFDALGLTAEEFDALGLTAYEFDHYGLQKKIFIDDTPTMMDMYGRESINPVPSAYSALANPIRAGDFDDLEITCTEHFWDIEITAYQHDRWGDYIYRLLSENVSRETLNHTVGFDDVNLYGEAPVTSEFFTISCGIGYDARGQILDDNSVYGFHPVLDVRTNVSSEYTVVRKNTVLEILNKRLSATTNNSIEVDGRAVVDLTLRNNTLSFSNLPVLTETTVENLTVTGEGSTRSKLIKIYE